MSSEAFLPLLHKGDILLAVRNTPVSKEKDGSSFTTTAFVLGNNEIVRQVGPLPGWDNEGSILESANYGSAKPLGIKAIRRDFGSDYPIPSRTITMAASSDIVELYAVEALQRAASDVLDYMSNNSWRVVDRLS